MAMEFQRLSSSQRRALAHPFMRSLAEQGIGAEAMYRTLREAGLSYRRSEMLRDYRNFLHLAAHERDIVNLSAEQFVPKSWFARGPEYQKSNIRYMVRYQAFLPVEQEIATFHVYISSERELTKAEVLEIAKQIVEPRRPGSPQDPTDFELIQAEYKPGYEFI